MPYQYRSYGFVSLFIIKIKFSNSFAVKLTKNNNIWYNLLSQKYFWIAIFVFYFHYYSTYIRYFINLITVNSTLNLNFNIPYSDNFIDVHWTLGTSFSLHQWLNLLIFFSFIYYFFSSNITFKPSFTTLVEPHLVYKY